ncbi:hypothetical protein HPB51_026854 [Rhipicephalus microplus]|uniref:Uncharacterized protein n=1 Tax=Rhipicephalus microplus TaxID=6941 RepID=A0A9J6D1Z1_RHIMP|nr:probable ATP-dependent RNA helicase DDX5 [Rhipicephalus microplus]KAH7985194.1 hypothetical protein HPB51_026854 [Rhipicephalus microplus]
MLATSLEQQLRLIVANVRPDHYMLMWLTSRTTEASQLAEEFIEDYVTVHVGETSQVFQCRRAEPIVCVCDENDKEDRLVAIFGDNLNDKRDKTIVFVESKGKVDDLVTSLRLRGWSAVGMLSKKTEQERE